MKKQFDKKLSLFKKGHAVYICDIKKWLKENTNIEMEKVVIGKVKNATQELHPLFFEVLDEIQRACPKAKIVLETDGLFLNQLQQLVRDYPDVEIKVLLKGYNSETYKEATGNYGFERVVDNLRTLKAYCEYNKLQPSIHIYSPFYGDIEQACFVKQLEQFGTFHYL